MGKPLSAVKKNFDDHKWEDDIEWHDFNDGKLHMIRVVGDIKVMSRHWVKTLSSKSFPQWCPQLDEETEKYLSDRPCPAHDDFGSDLRPQKVLVGNCIIRALQERGDDNPVRGFMLPHAINDDLHDIVEIIKCDPADPKKGIDLAIRYNSKAKGNKKWGLQRGERTPLTDDEKEFNFYDFEKLAPNFDDEEVQGEYALKMKDSMARMKYYVKQTSRVPDGARDPFKHFVGDIKGKPWTDFAVLVDYRNEQAGDKAKTVKTTHKEDDGKEEEVHDHEEPDEAPPPKESKSAPEPDGGDDDDTPPETSEKKKKSSEHPDDDIESKEHSKLGLVPDCFQEYTATAKCNRCPVRAKCIDETNDDDEF